MLWLVGQSSQLGLFLILGLRRTVLGPPTVSMGSVLFPTVLRVTLLCPPVHGGGVTLLISSPFRVVLETLVYLNIQLITCTDADIWVHLQEWAYGHVML